MKKRILKSIVQLQFGLIIIFGLSCSKSGDSTTANTLTGWDLIKANQMPKNELPTKYEEPFQQPNSTLAWEDGIYITRDGLTLYAQYTQMDLFKGTIEDGQSNPNLHVYKRGPSIGQDLTPPAGVNDWMHSDLILSTRTNLSDKFPAWTLSNVKKSLFNDAAPQGILNGSNPLQFDIFLYTDDDNNPSYAPKIRILRNVGRNPNGPGSYLLSTAVSSSNLFDENPHIERFDPADPNKLVLFFDSKSRSSYFKLAHIYVVLL